MPVLAINGGRPVRTDPFPIYVTIGEEERRAVLEVLDTTVLSKFLGKWSPEFYGGPQVNALEGEWARFFGARHAVSMNSATSCLYSAVGAAGVGPGDEVIVSPFTMSASATAALVYGGIPVFADIDPDIFCISPESVRRCITRRTKAIVAVDLFGHPADMDEIMEIAGEHDLAVIEDAAQAPGATSRGRYAGTLADIGVFSLNYHKTIHCGEGGMAVTGDPELAERLQLIRNHAEAVVKEKRVNDLVNMVGFNYRMTEIEAAIAREQLKKLPGLLALRRKAAEYLSHRLGGLPAITIPVVRPGANPGYYVYPIRFSPSEAGVSRDRFADALNAEGIPMGKGYAEPLYLQPVYQRRIAFGKDGYPFTFGQRRDDLHYEPGLCPVAERMYYRELMITDVCHANTTEKDLDDVIEAFSKVLGNLGELAG